MSTGIFVAVFKLLILQTQKELYETLADQLPKPAFYWPLALYPLIGSIWVSIATVLSNGEIRRGIDDIAKSIDSPNIPLELSLPLLPSVLVSSGGLIEECFHENDTIVLDPLQIHSILPITTFDPLKTSGQLIRLSGAVATLGSGCSLGPEGPAVEIGASLSRWESCI